MKVGLTAASCSLVHTADMADQARISSVLKRMAFGPRQGQVDEYGEASAEEVVERLLAASPIEPAFPELGTDDDYALVRTWWVEMLAGEDTAVHERMVWFWHTHLTSSLLKSEPALMLRQHRLLREHALGNFRELMQAITIDAAMLQWLDGASNTIEKPNENYGREVMELFTLGHASGAYTEADVRAATYTLAGWWIDGENGNEVKFDEAVGPQRAVEFLGSSVSSAEDVINVICDHPACATFVAGRVHQHLAGFPADDARLAELATAFRDGGLQIRVLVEAIVRHPSFVDAEYSRPRSGLEWWVAVNRFYGTEIDFWRLQSLDQLPMEPPNVAGWPGLQRWLSVSSVFEKCAVAWDYAYDLPTLDSDDPVGEVLAKAGLYSVSDETREALVDAAAPLEGLRERSSVLHALVACSPEFSLI